MKFNDKQLDGIAKVTSAFCIAAGVAAAVGITRPETVTSKEEIALILTCIGSFCAMLYVLGRIK